VPRLSGPPATSAWSINAAYIERLNATFRPWAPALTRRSHTPARELAHGEAAMCWRGVVSNVCRVQKTLHGTPAMAADLTDRIWSVEALRRWRVRQEELPAILWSYRSKRACWLFCRE
jgi:hypothetical protein